MHTNDQECFSKNRATNFGCASCLGVLCLWEWPQHIMLGIELALVHYFREFITSFMSIINIMISSPLIPRAKHFQWILVAQKECSFHVTPVEI